MTRGTLRRLHDALYAAGGRLLARRAHQTGALAAVVFALLAGIAIARAPFKAIPPTVPRPAGDYIPTTARFLRVSWSGKCSQTIIVSNGGQVARIARLVNELPAEGSGGCSEGFIEGPPTITFTFLGGDKRQVLAKATGWDSTMSSVAWCVPTTLAVRHHKRLLLEGGGYLIAHAEKILGVPLQ